MLDCIKVVDLEIFAYHGVLEEEKKTGQNFYVSFHAYLDISPSAKEDDLNLSVSYADMCMTVKTYVQSAIYDLIETVTEGIARELLLTYPLVREVEVTLKKPSAPIGEPVAYPAIVANRGWHRVFIGIGSNMGDSRETIAVAIKRIEECEEHRLLRSSTLIETEPWGNVEQPNFVNGVLEIETMMKPRALMAFLLEVEKDLDRVREIKWGPRTIDLDVLLYDDLVTDDPVITVPHPLMTKRAFVLEPLCEIGPNVVHPIYRKRMFELLDELKCVEEVKMKELTEEE